VGGQAIDHQMQRLLAPVYQPLGQFDKFGPSLPMHCIGAKIGFLTVVP
jgi:hypothetical protein